MTDRDALLLAVLAAPDDDLPRLVFADWLEEHGEPEWAVAIRVMCAVPHEFDSDVQVERMGAVRPSPDMDVVLGWLETHAPHHLSMMVGGRKCDRVPGEWPWVTGCPSLGLRVEWRRGFIAEVRGPIELVQTHLPRIVAVQPVEVAEATDVVVGNIGGRYYIGRHEWPLPARLAAAAGTQVTFDSAKAARAALSTLMIAEARGTST